ncbi:DUF4326 domain-containing protein [Aliivibrio fischeri]|uniref:DUF4326 domain-containing protein n=1 Tax=Aliivibrio fischeri TaxID=668 RepID=UPI00080E0692|nr:DUF4326 domain-containing protein [Aliivibrio fischeri]OCH06791.1 hypothetical protein A6E09_17795 [Aliivibrio fischeri]
MINIVIIYPKLFNCVSKFNRKVERIIKNLDTFKVSYMDDSNNLIESFFHDYEKKIDLINISELNVNDISHAIIFDDGECFSDEFELLKSNGILIRNISIDITRVVNIKIDTEFNSNKSTSKYEYIGRGSYWGNPYSLYEDGDRDEVIRKFKYDFDYEKFINVDKKEVFKLSGKRLGCFCKPQACHGDVLADFLNSWDDGK